MRHDDTILGTLPQAFPTRSMRSREIFFWSVYCNQDMIKSPRGLVSVYCNRDIVKSLKA